MKKEDLGQDMTIDQTFEALDQLAGQLENPNVSLEEAFCVYQKGMELLKACSQKIDTVEKKMLQLNENGELSEF